MRRLHRNPRREWIGPPGLECPFPSRLHETSWADRTGRPSVAITRRGADCPSPKKVIHDPYSSCVATSCGLLATCSLVLVGLSVTGVGGTGVARAATQTITPAIRTVQANAAPLFAGSGRPWDGPAVAVLDSGVDVHSELNLAGTVDCTGSGSGADGNGHGTGVSGIIAARDNGSGIVGVAPGAPIYSVRVLDSKLRDPWQPCNAGCSGCSTMPPPATSRWPISASRRRAPMTVVAATTTTTLCIRSCVRWSAGITVVSSAGNESSSLSGLIPAAYDEVLTATNVADYDGVPGGLSSPPCVNSAGDDRRTPRATTRFHPRTRHTPSLLRVCARTRPRRVTSSATSSQGRAWRRRR